MWMLSDCSGRLQRPVADKHGWWWRREDKVAEQQVTIVKSAMEAIEGTHAVAILTEWKEFKSLDWKAILGKMQQPAFIFDGRNVLDHAALRALGFVVYALGKPLDPFLSSATETIASPLAILLPRISACLPESISRAGKFLSGVALS
jgi:UDP-glucose/GDP-mannose dehydrogenase family, UDP binding domain